MLVDAGSFPLCFGRDHVKYLLLSRQETSKWRKWLDMHKGATYNENIKLHKQHNFVNFPLHPTPQTRSLTELGLEIQTALSR